MAHFSPDFIRFFEELAAHNEKAWFDANRKRYETFVKAPFASFVEKLIDQVREDDPAVMITPKDAIFRINRDIRFSKDKTPYKTQVSAIVSPGGRKDKSTPGLYLELSTQGVGIYGGAHFLEKEPLLRVRSAIAQDPKGFAKAIAAPEFVSHFGEIRGDKNKRLPKEFVAAAEQQPLIANKAFYYMAKLPAKHILADDLLDVIMKYYYAAKPVKEWLTLAMKN